jgi:hypothetical protein
MEKDGSRDTPKLHIPLDANVLLNYLCEALSVAPL